jgi:hypothetical protein
LPEAERDHRADISHGICAEHLKRMREDLAKRKAVQTATASR